MLRLWELDQNVSCELERPRHLVQMLLAEMNGHGLGSPTPYPNKLRDEAGPSVSECEAG